MVALVEEDVNVALAGGAIAVVNIGEVAFAIEVNGILRNACAEGEVEIVVAGPEVDARELVGAFLPVELELHAVVKKSADLFRVEDSAAAVLGAAVPGFPERAVGIPYAHPLWLEIVLGDPEATV